MLVGEIVEGGQSEERVIGGRRSTRSAAVEKRGDWWKRRRKRRVGSLGSMHDGRSQETIWKRDCYWMGSRAAQMD